MKLRPLAGRFLLGAIGSLGLVGLAIDAIDGVFVFRGRTTSLADNSGQFWVSVLLFGALFAGLLLWAISGVGFARDQSNSGPD